jgi:hypothetical protein
MGILTDLFGPGTWGAGGNLVAWVICGALGVTAAWLFRDRLGPVLAAWWHRHQGEHLRGDLDALEARLKEHITSELARQADSGGQR